MKKIKLITAAIVLFTAFNFISCSNEPIDPEIDLGNWGTKDITGSYKMSGFYTSIPTDLNNDKTASVNQMDETNCFNDNYLTLNADQTFVKTSKLVDIVNVANVASLNCVVNSEVTGTWILTGNAVTLTYTLSGTQTTEIFTHSGNKLVSSTKQGKIVGTSSDNVPVFLTADVEVFYTK
jgi:hypothetical protein